MKYMKVRNLLALIISMPLFACTSCGFQAVFAKDSELIKEAVVKEEPLKYDSILQVEGNKNICIRKDIDLEGKIVIIPEGVTLIPSGGVIKNGTLVGNKTRINGNRPLFNNIHISGNWIKKDITTDLFISLDYENSLRDVLALASPDVINTIEIKDGNYRVSAKPFQSALDICSNTTIEIEGIIKLLPNDYKGCYVLQVRNAENVTINGGGSIVGDKKEHKGSDGEWGHGINVIGSHNVNIIDMTVSNCWGDCIYVGNESKDITIKNCNLKDGRRQGVSVTSADRVTIEDCIITEISGTDPQAAIDIEPNHNESVDDILIRNIHCENCYGGIEAWRPDDARIGRVVIDGCEIINTKKQWPLAIWYAENASVENSTIDADERTAIMATQVGNLLIKKNNIRSTSMSPISISKCKKNEVKENIIN